VGLSIVALLLTVVTIETSVLVGNIKTTIVATLQDGEHTSTSGGTAETDIQIATEGTLLTNFSNVVSTLLTLTGLNFTINLFVALVHLSHTELSKKTAGTEKTSAVSSSIVGKTELHTITRKFSRGSSTHHTITNDLSRNNLSNDLVVGDTGNKSVLRGVVLILGLNDQSLTSIVIGLALYIISLVQIKKHTTTTTKLGLETLEVSLALNNLNETL
jgi:hypothetical protein